MARRHTIKRVFSGIHISPSARRKTSIRPGLPWNPGPRPNVLVAASAADQPLGYVSCHLDRPAGGANRVGRCRTGRRGTGIGKSLVWPLDWFSEGAQKVTVVTQGKNRAAQRLYQQCGFLSRDLQRWYHKWYPIWITTKPGQPTKPMDPNYSIPFNQSSLRAGNWSTFSGR